MYTPIANVLPSDLFFPESVASVSGLSGSAVALRTIVVFELAAVFPTRQRRRVFISSIL